MDLETSPKVIAIAVVVVMIVYQLYRLTSPNLDAIPALGYSSPLLSYIDAFKFQKEGGLLVEQGIKKFKGAPFKIALMRRWQVIVTKPEVIEDMRRAGDNDMNFSGASRELLQTETTFGHEVISNRYHVGVVRNPLTRALPARFEDVCDEMVAAFQDILPVTKDWTPVSTISVVPRIVSRVSNRLFTGSKELCRSDNYSLLNVAYTLEAMKVAAIINALPRIFQPTLDANLTRMTSHLAPLILERIAQTDREGPDWDGRPKDMISWLLDETTHQASDPTARVRSIAGRFLALNVAAIHTTSLAFNHALYHLAASPSLYLSALREEVDAAIRDYGWTKDALKQLNKVDSFLRESAQVDFGNLAMSRYIVRDFTFSDGLTLPKGAYVAVGMSKAERESFDGFRYSRLRQDVPSDESSSKYLFTTCNQDHLSFGYGKHACPGRFFAAQELKLMLAYVVTHYDVKFDMEEGVRPLNEKFGIAVVPNTKAKVLFRKRQGFKG